MRQPIGDALPMLYVLCRDWLAGRDLLAALGVEDPDRLDVALDLHRRRGATSSRDRAERQLHVAAMGGEIG